MKPDERREHPRYQLKLPINLHGERWSRAILVDLSRGGIWLRGHSAARVGDRVSISIRRYGEGSCKAQGQVIRVSSMPRIGGFAVEFHHHNSELGDLLDAAERLPPRDRAPFLATEIRPTLELSRV